MTDDVELARIKELLKHCERWFVSILGAEDVVPTDPYLQDLKHGLALCRRFTRMVYSNETNLDELNEIANELKKDVSGHGWMDLRGLVMLWRDRQTG